MMQGLYKQAIVQLSNLQCSLVSSTLFTGDVFTVGKGRHWDPPPPHPSKKLCHNFLNGYNRGHNP